MYFQAALRAQPRGNSGRQAESRDNLASRRVTQSWRRVVPMLQAVKIGQLNIVTPDETSWTASIACSIVRSALLRSALAATYLWRIVTTPMEGMTLADSPQSTPCAANCPVLLHRSNEVRAARRIEPAMPPNQRA